MVFHSGTASKFSVIKQKATREKPSCYRVNLLLFLSIFPCFAFRVTGTLHDDPTVYTLKIGIIKSEVNFFVDASQRMLVIDHFSGCSLLWMLACLVF